MNIPPLLHGNHWTGQHVGGWWCSPKFDGWRAYWTGSQLVSRQGNGYRAPASFTASLPAFPLDCELWLGHGFTDKDVHKAVAHGQWEKLWIVAFDVPGTIAETGIQILRSLILTLAESDRKNETAISDKIVANLAAAFEALKKGIEPVSFARR